jgi:hypothetical protein
VINDTLDPETVAMLDRLAAITECRRECREPEGMVCVGDVYLALRDPPMEELHRMGLLWLGCES